MQRCVATRAAWTTENTPLLLLRAFASAVMCLPSRCLPMNYSGFQASRHNTVDFYSNLTTITDTLPEDLRAFLQASPAQLAKCFIGEKDLSSRGNETHFTLKRVFLMSSSSLSNKTRWRSAG
jgi:hypothetical protein